MEASGQSLLLNGRLMDNSLLRRRDLSGGRGEGLLDMNFREIKEAVTLRRKRKIGGIGFEPMTSSVSRKRSTPEPTA